MLSLTGGVVLFAAMLHASWNAMLHGNRDRFLSMTWMSIAIGVVATIVVVTLPLPVARRLGSRVRRMPGAEGSLRVEAPSGPVASMRRAAPR